MLNADRPLSAEAMGRAMDAMMTSSVPADEVAAFLRTLAQRGETAEEIAAAVAALRAHVVPLPLAHAENLCDTCGTGGDGQGTFNISTLAALVAAAAGVRIAKHGNRAASSRCGSADLLEALGVNLAAPPAVVARCIDELGFGFCFAPQFHPAMKAVSSIRKALGIRTLFNLIGPLANPAPIIFQLVGVSDEKLLRPMGEALQRLGVRHGLVVHGMDGLDEITTTGPTQTLELRNERLTPGQIDPLGFGIPRATLRDLQGGEVRDNVQMARRLLAGERLPLRDAVLVNAGCAIYVADRAATIPEGIKNAEEALTAGRARTLLERVKELSHVG